MKKSKSRFSGKVSGDAKRQKERASSSSYGYLNVPRGTTMFSAEPGGRTMIDIIPYEVTDPQHPDRDTETGTALAGDLWYKRPFKVHRNIGAANDAYVCLTSFGKRCPICEYRSRQMKEGAPKSETDALKTSNRVLYVVIPKGQKGMEEVPMMWDISQYNFQDLLQDEIEENVDYEVFPDLEVGLSLRIRFDSLTVGKSKPFAKASRIDFIERDAPYAEEILDTIPNLDKVLKELSFKELETLFLELPDGEADDAVEVIDEPDEVDEIPVPVRKRKTVVEESEDEPEPEPAPAPRRRPAPVVEVEEEVEEEVIEEEEEIPEPAPAPRRKPAPAPAPAPAKKDGKEKCLHGHVFGVDTDMFDHCDKCRIWEDCIDVKEGK